jgi:ring-1,2-phenylacetyl-CoA epoxidase subunit PaaD
MTAATRPEIAQIWRWLETVPDPEIPVISVVDLGIVREVAWSGDELVITITPTYSGCPATQVIGDDIRAALRTRGLEQVRLVTRLAPAWTTDWLSESGRAKLHGYGIAPPAHKVVDASRILGAAVVIPCPRCGSVRTTRLATFASTPCKALYRCDDCREPFDYFKPH